MSDTYLSPIRTLPAFRLLVLLSSFMFLLLIAAAIGSSFSLIPGIGGRTSMLLASVVQCVVGFCLSAWITAKFSSDTPLRFLGVGVLPLSGSFIVGIIIVYLLVLPAMNQLIEWNATLHFPQWASGLEKTLRGWEDANNAMAEKVLASGSFWGMIEGVAVVGILTGFSEELFFRGALQKIFVASRVNRHVAVWGAAAVFSAVHFQFFGFFPRLLMGAFFGYLYLWTGSIWPSAFAHALNNSIVVIGYWFVGLDGTDAIESFGVARAGTFPWSAIASTIATALFLWKFSGLFFKNKRKKDIDSVSRCVSESEENMED